VVSPSLGSAYTELLYKDVGELVKVPACSPAILGAAVAGCTASMGLNIVGEMGSGETVLITAAAGGVGSWCVQLAKLAGNHVIGTCSTEAKAQELRRLGCDRVILYRDEDLGQVLSTEYPDGIELIFEHLASNIALVESGKVDPLLDPTVFSGVDNAVNAVEFLHSGKNIGKVTVRY
jgi:NADPH-dependent curcumin reductase CurA